VTNKNRMAITLHHNCYQNYKQFFSVKEIFGDQTQGDTDKGRKRKKEFGKYFVNSAQIFISKILCYLRNIQMLLSDLVFYYVGVL